MRTIIIDTHSKDCERLTQTVKAHPRLEWVATFDSILKADNAIVADAIDLILMDVDLPDANGLTYVRHLVNPPRVVFLTANRDYAVDSYALNVMDYVLKPYTNERFLQAIEKVFWTTAITEKKVSETPFFYLKVNSHFIKIEWQKVLYLKAMENYTQIVTKDRNYTVLMSLKAFEKQLPPSVFVRANRSNIVNVTKIESINKTEIIIGDQQIDLTRTYAEAIFNNLINKHLIQ